MPVDLEMFLSHTGASLFDYSPFSDDRFSFASSYDEDGFIRGIPFSKNHILIPNDPERVEYLGKKKAFDSCKTEESITFKKPNGHITDGGKKKKVTFADDKGFSLVEIREIPGSPVAPSTTLTPFMSDAKQTGITQKKWKVAFEQPPWTDSKLIELLEINKVALESVSLKLKADDTLEGTVKVKRFDYKSEALEERNLNDDPEDVLEGTVKVKNLEYEKHVFVRVSFDRWLSTTDVKANYIKPAKNPEKNPEYDTFSFSINIPPTSLKYEVIEFCIGFHCNSGEFWDNNGGVNYRLVTEVVKKNSTSVNRFPKSKSSNDRITLSLTENIEKFSEIDSWSSFMRSQPYW